MSVPKSPKNAKGVTHYVRALQETDDTKFLEQAQELMEEPGKKSTDQKEIKGMQIFEKICRNGAKRKTRVVLSHARDWVIWDHTGAFSFIKNKHSNRLEVAHISRIERGTNNVGFFSAKAEKTRGSQEQLERGFVLVGQDRSLKVICPTKEVCDVWLRACELMIKNLNTLPKGNPFYQYLQDQWNRADTDRSGTLNVKEVMQIMRKMNVTKSKKEIEQEIALFDDDRSGQLDNREFKELMKKIFSDRPEIKKMMHNIVGSEHLGDESVTVKMLHKFLNETQRAGRQSEPEVTEEECRERIRDITHDDRVDSLSLMEFAMLLDSGENTVLDPIKAQRGAGTPEKVYMSQPLSHYWINSSHNTYLTSDQLKGHSSADQYTNVLQRGCRCVELDCWDGAAGVPEGNKGDEPIITHGHTLCTKIFFRDVIKVIANNAFGPPANNPYPVILSIEMHCSLKFQRKMWEICEEVLGESMLLLPEDEDAIDLLGSPWELRNKILIKGKRLKPASHSAQAAAEESDSSDDDDDAPPGGTLNTKHKAHEKAADKSKEKKKVKIEENWSRLVFLSAVHFKSFDTPGKGFEMSSFSEKKCKKLCGDEASRHKFITHNMRQLSRVYPFGGRIDSSNMQPINAWASGCQLVALNFQTGDVPMQLNYGKFAENGNTGYVLKPPCMRETGVRACEVLLQVKVLSCQRLPNNNASRDIVDPYVRVELYGVDEDEKLNEKTQRVDNNGFNPTFNGGDGKLFEFHIRNRECAMLRIAVLDEDLGQDDFIGQFCLPVTCIRNGYRHVPLYDAQNGTVHSAGVLCWLNQRAL